MKLFLRGLGPGVLTFSRGVGGLSADDLAGLAALLGTSTRLGASLAHMADHMGGRSSGLGAADLQRVAAAIGGVLGEELGRLAADMGSLGLGAGGLAGLGAMAAALMGVDAGQGTSIAALGLGAVDRIGVADRDAMAGGSGSGAGPGPATPQRQQVTLRAQTGAQSAHACAACGATNATKQCAACRSVRYCSVSCQSTHWGVHKAECRRLRETRGV